MFNQAEIIDQYRIDDLGAPFCVILERSVGIVHGEHGPAPVIPDLGGLIHQTAVARARHPLRLSGPDLTFLRRASEESREDYARIVGSDVASVIAYENGTRAIPGPIDRLARIHACYHVREMIPEGRLRLAAFLDWVFDEYRYVPLGPAQDEMIFSFSYENSDGWVLRTVSG